MIYVSITCLKIRFNSVELDCYCTKDLAYFIDSLFFKTGIEAFFVKEKKM